MPKRGFPFAVTLTSMTISCLLLTAFHRFLGGIMLVGLACCYDLSHLLPAGTVVWVTVLVRTGIVAAVLISVGRVCYRLRRTYRFVTHLNEASFDANPAVPERLMTVGSALKLTAQVVIVETSQPLAFCFGLFTPRIYLSTGVVDTLSDKELAAVLVHEAFHCQRYDPLRTLLVDSIATTLFFLPAAAEWRDQWLTSIELAADRHAMQVSGRVSLAAALYKLLTHPLATPFSTLGLAGMTGSSTTAARLAQVLDNAPLSLRFSPHSLLSSSLILIIVCMALSLAHI